MKSFRLVPLAVVSVAMSFVSTALAETTKMQIGIWREVQPKYEFKHPMTVTCEEFLDTDAIYRPYVVAWLGGRSMGLSEGQTSDAFVLISVPPGRDGLQKRT